MGSEQVEKVNHREAEFSGKTVFKLV